MKKYDPEAEGALYTRRKLVKLDGDSLKKFHERIKTTNEGGFVDVAIQNAMVVLREHFNQDVELSPDASLVTLNGRRVGPPADSCELVKDAFSLIDCARQVKKLQARIESGEAIKVVNVTRLLVTRSMQLGQDHERMMMRFLGHEKTIAGRKKSNRNAMKGGKPKYTNQELQRYIDKAKNRYPMANKTALIEAAREISRELCPQSKGVAKSTFWSHQKNLNF